jgi:hypothetical protein
LFAAAAYGGTLPAVQSDYDLTYNGLAWDVSGLLVDGTVKVVPLQPAISQIVLSGDTLTLSGTQGTPGVSYRVLSSTNATLPVAQWQAVGPNYFNFDGSFTYSETVNPAQPAQFYLIAVP